MSSNHLYNCLNCGRQYNPAVLKKCPVCQTAHLQSIPPAAAPSPSSVSQANAPASYTGSSQAPAIPSAWSNAKSSYAYSAASSAKTVDSYGKVIQVVGYILSILTFIFFTFIWGPESDLKFYGFLLGVIAGALTAWIYQVIGALYRMIANYILFRTTQ